MSEERKIYSLYQLNQSLENHIIQHFSSVNFWITAELIRINEKNGHFYMELADSNKTQTTARSQAVIWASRYRSIVTEVGAKELHGILQPGNRILLNVKIEYHAVFGLKLKVRDIDPSYSYGEIERKKQAVIEQLKKENLLLRQQKVILPTVIKRIALIGSPNTSGFRDFLNELFNNHEFHQFKIKEFPVSVQGTAAAKEIVTAFEQANQFDVDAIVLLRGGGSKMDLSLFDDYSIAKAIAVSRLPVLTGIGHETDEVVADLVARMHFTTPTAVGRHIQYEIKSFKEILRGYHDKTMQIALQVLAKNKEGFIHLNNYMSLYSREILHFWRKEFNDKEVEIYQFSRTVLFVARDGLMNLSHHLSSQLQQRMHNQRNGLDKLLNDILFQSIQRVEHERHSKIHPLLSNATLLSLQKLEREQIILSNQEELLGLLNPLRIMAAGYTISMVRGKDIKNSTIEVGDEMKTLTTDHIITSKITGKTKVKHGNNG